MKAFRNPLLFLLLVCWMPLAGHAALRTQTSILGKFHVSAVSGTVTCVVDGRILDLKKGDTFMARGTAIQTAAGSTATLVFSNGTAIYTAEDTRFEIETFDQEFFAPNNNLRIEPSTSSTLIHLGAGRLVISTPRLQSGTSMVYETALAQTRIRGTKIIVETSDKHSRTVVIDGEASVSPRGPDGEFVSIGQRITSNHEALIIYAKTGDQAALTTQITAAPAGGDTTGTGGPTVVAQATVAVDGPSSAAPLAARPTEVSTTPITAETEALVLKLTGMATVRLANQSFDTPVAEGTALARGATIITGDNGELHLQAYPGAIATIRPKSTVEIEQLSVTTANGSITRQSALLNVRAGTVVSMIDPARRLTTDYGVRTPKGIAMAHGTSFAVTVEDESFTVASTADTVTFTTPSGDTYTIDAGNVTITPAGGDPLPPISLANAVAASPAFAQTIQTALNVVSNVVQNNIGTLPASSATDLLTKVASSAAAALPAQAAAITTQAVNAVISPSAATSSTRASSAAAVTEAIAAVVPAQAAQIATAAVVAAPTHAATVAAAAAKGAPTHAAQIASAVTQTFVQTASDGSITPATLQTAAAVAAAVTSSAPGEAAPVAAAVMLALSQAAPLSAPLATSQTASTIAAAVTNVAPAQAVPVASAMMRTIAQTPTFADASPQIVAQTAATLASAVTNVVPPQAQNVASAVMQLVVELQPTASPAATAQAAGLISAAVSSVVPAQTTAVTQAVALAANQPLVSVQAAAAQSTQAAAAVAQQLAQINQSTAIASQQSSTAIAAVAAGSANSSGIVAAAAAPASQPLAGGIANTGTTPQNALASPSSGATTAPAGGIGESGVAATSVIVTEFDPAGVSGLMSDLDAAQAAQTTVQFSPDTTGGAGGTPTVTPTPVVPPVLDSNLVTSSANG